ncbi:MAG: PP2C family protein-serine/threonine phosphatase [Myxococcota bacterium]
MSIDVAGRTDPGRRRPKNEDQYLIAGLEPEVVVFDASFRSTLGDPSRASPPLVMAVADGMGGHGGGDVASRVVMQAVLRGFEHKDDLQQIISDAQRDLDDEAQQRPDHPTMGTTLTVVQVDPPGLVVGHVGDSRAYLLRDGNLEQLTTDHTLAEQLKRELRSDQDTGPDSPMHHILYNALQAHSDREPKPDVFRLDIRDEDVVMLCSDGLTKEVPEDVILRGLAEGTTSRAIVDRLVTTARDAGGSDNITVVVLRLKPQSS